MNMESVETWGEFGECCRYFDAGLAETHGNFLANDLAYDGQISKNGDGTFGPCGGFAGKCHFYLAIKKI